MRAPGFLNRGHQAGTKSYFWCEIPYVTSFEPSTLVRAEVRLRIGMAACNDETSNLPRKYTYK